MRRIDTLNKATDLFGSGKHGWKNGIPGTGDRPTEGKAEWFNSLQEEVAATVEATGQALNAASNVQLLAAIRELAGPLNNYLSTVILGDGVTDRSATLVAANAAGRPIHFFGVIHVATPTTITVPILSNLGRIFTDTSQVTIDSGQPLQPEWFGLTNGCIDRTVAALPSTGGVIELACRAYPPSGYFYGYAAAGKNVSKSKVVFRGAKMPSLNATCTALEGGSIIQGTVLAFADEIEFRNLGVDMGKALVDSAYGGALPGGAGDALMLSYRNDADKTANALRKCAKLHNVIGLCRNPTDPSHAILIEGYEDVTVSGDVTGVFGFYGVVIKSAAVRVDNAAAWLNGQVGVYIKSGEEVTSVVRNIEIKSITSLSAGPAQGFAPHATPGGTGAGVLVQASGANVDKVHIGQIREAGHATGVDFAFLTGVKIGSVRIGSVMTEGNSVQGTNLQASPGFTLSRLDIGSIESRNTPVALTGAWDNSEYSSVHIGSVMGLNCTTAVLALSQSADPIIDCVVAENCAAAYYLAGQAKPTIGALKLVGTMALPPKNVLHS